MNSTPCFTNVDHSAECECAKGPFEAWSGEIRRRRIMEGEEAARSMYQRSHHLNQSWRATAVTLGMTPATNQYEAKQKRQATGRAWLKAEGHAYDLMREGIAEDEARFAGKGSAA